jgi:hypothetical protein
MTPDEQQLQQHVLFQAFSSKTRHTKSSSRIPVWPNHGSPLPRL